MLEENRQDLNEFLYLFQSDEDGYKAKKEAELQAQIKFSSDFEKLKHEIIWPVIVEVGNELTKFSHDFHVTEEKEYVDAIACFHPAHMTLNIYPSSLEEKYKKPDTAPYISFAANNYAKKVGINVSTMMPGEGGSIGSHGEYEPRQFTKDFVEKELINVLKNTLIFHNA